MITQKKFLHSKNPLKENKYSMTEKLETPISPFDKINQEAYLYTFRSGSWRLAWSQSTETTGSLVNNNWESNEASGTAADEDILQIPSPVRQ